VTENTLIPSDQALLSEMRFENWLRADTQSGSAAAVGPAKANHV
jgi:hypothetical protein